MNKLTIETIIEGGVGNRERIFMKALMDENLGKYVVLHTKELGKGRISSSPISFLWLPDREVKGGDFVLLYTGVAGKNNSFSNNTGTTTHVIFWGLIKTIFNTAEDAVALLRIDDWTYKARGNSLLPPIKLK